MFERFTEPARRVVVFAQEQARSLNFSYIGTEHLLLGLLLVEDGIASPELQALGVSVEGVRALITDLLGPGTSAETSGQIPFTPHAKKALEAALHAAFSLGSNEIGPEHLLLGLAASDKESVGVRILRKLDVEESRIRRSVISAIELGHTTQREAVPDMDRSWLDFTPDEACLLAKKLAPLASTISFEVRPHPPEEHTLRVSCRPRGNDGTLRDLVALEADGIRAVLDHDGTVRLGHLH